MLSTFIKHLKKEEWYGFSGAIFISHLTIIQNIQAGLLKYDKNDTEQNKIIYE